MRGGGRLLLGDWPNNNNYRNSETRKMHQVQLRQTQYLLSCCFACASYLMYVVRGFCCTRRSTLTFARRLRGVCEALGTFRYVAVTCINPISQGVLRFAKFLFCALIDSPSILMPILCRNKYVATKHGENAYVCSSPATLALNPHSLVGR